MGGDTQADRDRIELLRTRVEHAETLTAILAGLRGIKSRDAVQRAILNQDRVRWTWRTALHAYRTAGVQAEALTARNLNAGERLGLRRGELEERSAELEERIAARPGRLADWLDERLARLGEYRARMESRIEGRASRQSSGARI